MKRITCNLARKANRVTLGLWMIVLGAGLSGCSFAPQSSRTPIERLDFYSSTASADGVKQGLSEEDYDEKSIDRPEKLGLSETESKALGCKIGDRFDRGATLAYNFKDDQSRLALHLRMDGPKLSDPSRLEINTVMFRFTHKFSKPPEGNKKKCRIQSSFQGILGSGYNELFIRNNYTIWKELRDKF